MLEMEPIEIVALVFHNGVISIKIKLLKMDPFVRVMGKEFRPASFDFWCQTSVEDG